MNNIKTVEVVKALPGLEVGDTLTRLTPNDNFELRVETVTDTYTAKRVISLSETLLNKDEFKAIEWFKPVKTNKQRIAELEKENSELRDRIVSLVEAASKEDWKSDRFNLISKRIESKILDYTKEFGKIESILNKNLYSQDYEEYANEALTVYKNMIDLLKEIKK